MPDDVEGQWVITQETLDELAKRIKTLENERNEYREKYEILKKDYEKQNQLNDEQRKYYEQLIGMYEQLIKNLEIQIEQYQQLYEEANKRFELQREISIDYKEQRDLYRDEIQKYKLMTVGVAAFFAILTILGGN